MSLRIYNTLSRRTEDFIPLQSGQVSMYVCGPTVYDAAHIGHGMSSLVFDFVRRYLLYRGFQVRYVMNYTDVDDKIIQRAQHLGEDPGKLADHYIQEYDRQLKELNVLPATVFPRATGEIPAIIDMVARLLEADYAYVANGDVYYRVRKDSGYGKLSHRRLEEMNAGARVQVGERKEHPMDFALWKAAKFGEPAWDSPWGLGRPGWHIECSAMVVHHLGQQIDIHGGGNDLIFPHHENEIAQSESLTGKPFVKYWMHNGMMQLSGEKMSKSLGNLITIKEFLAHHEPEVLRMMVLNTNYRHPLVYGDEVVESATRGLDRLRSGLKPALPGVSGSTKKEIDTVDEAADDTRARFIADMDDDFNTSAALAAMFELVRLINQVRDSGATNVQLKKSQGVLTELSDVFGLRLQRKEKQVDPAPFVQLAYEVREQLDGSKHAEVVSALLAATKQKEAAPIIDTLLEARNQLRSQKQWKLSDLIRDQLAKHGIQVEDSAGGTSWRWE